MGVLRSAVHWWEESQLRVLVLTSMVVQFLLVIFSFLRRRAIPGWFRFIMWLSYLGGDAVAIYALATLFNRHSHKAAGEDGGGSSGMLEVVWAPVLLLHLGGNGGITAYNIEDNELWSRHLLTAVSQVTVAIYVFCKTWPPGSDKRLLQAAIVLFVPGVLKCFAKPWALKRASIHSLVSSPAAVKQEGVYRFPLEEYVKRAKDFVTEQTDEGSSMEDELADMDPGTSTGKVRRFVEHMKARIAGNLRESVEDLKRISLPLSEAGRARAERIREMIQGHSYTSELFVELSSSYSDRLRMLMGFCGLTEKRAYGLVRQGLATAFLLLYTKFKTLKVEYLDVQANIGVEDILSAPIQGSCMFLPWAAIGLFHHSHREAYNSIDVKITYVILCCTAALEFFSIGSLIEQLTSTGEAGEEWPEMVAQRSFIGYVARSNKKMRIVSCLLGCCKEFLDQQDWCTRPCFSSRRITRLVHQYLKAGWRQKIHDAASYRRFNDNRGHWALEFNELEDYLGWSIKGPFDESVLRWHIATDFCFFLSSSTSDHRCAFAEVPSAVSVFMMSSIDERNNRTSSSRCSEQLTNCKAVLCKQMSDYMAYLLLVNPEMLLPGSRRNLFATAQEEAEALFKNSGEKPPPGLKKRELALKIISKLESPSQGFQEFLIQEAWLIAQKLQSLGDEKKMWEVIQGVWVEMLCYSAGRCRGFLHAKALGSGGEFLSYVWLLMFYMGMETFTDKLQREEQDLRPSHDHDKAAGNHTAATAPSSTSELGVSSTTSTAAASASEDHTDAAGASTAPSTSEIQDDMV